jgi:pilus assembly protein CpaE
MQDDFGENNILLLKDRVDEPVIPEIEEDTKSEDQQREAQVWAYQGVHGGAGVTSLVVQTAYELANGHAKTNRASHQVLLIDLDFERGNSAAYMDIQPSMRIEELNAAAGRMDIALASTFIRPYRDNLSAIIAEAELGGNDQIDPTALLSLLDIVSTMFDYIILDVPQMWRTWSQAVIGAADQFTLVTELSVPGLHRTKELTKSIGDAMDLAIPPQILVNKYERRALRNGVTLKDAMTVLDRQEIILICTDEDTLRQAINSGQPVGRFKSESRYAKAVREHVEARLPNKNNQRAEDLHIDRRQARSA